MIKKVEDRFLEYVSYDTQSDYNSLECPSSEKQFNLAKKLVEDLKEIGLKDVSLDDNCYVMATLPSNVDKDVPTIGFIAHMDTSPDASGENVNPKITRNYDGGDIVLNEDQDITLSVKDFPELKNYLGQSIITTDGTTLLGSDDKAGVAEIISAMEYLIKNPEIKHGEIKVGFTPDEEIGRGADLFDVEKFGAQYAYTIDGGGLGGFYHENFNASTVEVLIKGVQVHPGTSKNKTISAIQLSNEFHGMLPEHERPESTEEYEGFYQLIRVNGAVSNTKMTYIIRDHDIKLHNKRKEKMQLIAKFLNEKYENKIEIILKITDSYFNMASKIKPHPEIIDMALMSMKEAGINPNVTPTRGGTDGARLSYMGLPCPNIFQGGHNFHGIYEYISIESMEKAVEVIVNIAKNVAK